MLKKLFSLFLGLCLFYSVPAFAEDNVLDDFARQRIAVIPIYQHPELTPGYIKELQRFLEIDVISLKEVEYVIEKSGLKPYEFLNVEQTAKIGKELNADLALFTDCEINPLIATITSSLVGVKKGNLIKAETVSGQASEATELITRLAFRIMAKRYYVTPLKGYPKIKQKKAEYNKKQRSYPTPRSSWAYNSVPLDELTFIDAKQFSLDFNHFFWLVDNESLLGILTTKDEQSIAVLNIKTGSYKMVYRDATNQPIISVSLSPDNRFVAFSTADTIYLLDSDGSKQAEELTKGAYPSWSPDGDKLAYMASKNESEIWVYDIKNKRKKKVMSSGSIANWLDNAREIIVSYSLKKPSVTIINELQVTRKVKGRLAIPMINTLGQSGFGGEKIAFSPNGRLFLGIERNFLTINDLWRKKRSPFLVLGNKIKLERGSIAWSIDGSKVAFREFSNNKSLLTVGEIGEKPKTYLKVNLGLKDGIHENDKLALIRLELENSPITDLVSKFTEKKIGHVKVFQSYLNCSTLIFPLGEVNVDSLDKVKAVDQNGQIYEGTIITLEPGIESYTKSTDKVAERYFNLAIRLVEDGNWLAALPYLEVVIKYFPDYTNALKVEELYNGMRNAD